VRKEESAIEPHNHYIKIERPIFDKIPYVFSLLNKVIPPLKFGAIAA